MEKTAHAYVACFGGKAKHVGLATAKALEILKADGYEVIVKYYRTGTEVPQVINYA